MKSLFENARCSVLQVAEELYRGLGVEVGVAFHSLLIGRPRIPTYIHTLEIFSLTSDDATA